jgi:hypothetical protein
MGARMRSWRDETGDLYALGATRVVLGVLLFWNARRAFRDLLQGDYFGDVFHWPIVPESFVPSLAVYKWIVAGQLLIAALVVAGYRARPALFVSALAGTYVLLCDRLQFHHNRWALFCFSLLLSLSPCDRSFCVTGESAPTRIGPLWGARLAQLQVSIVYLASGGSKLLDPDWRSGQVMLERFRLYGQAAVEQGIPQAVVDWFCHPDPASAIAKVAIATELFLAFGLWGRTRVFALWWGLWFHLSIELSSSVEGFSWLMLGMYGLFATPDVRARKLFYDSSRWRGRCSARIVRMADWLARFEVKAWAPDAVKKGHSVVVVRRDGTLATGIGALAMVARATPPFFLLWAPLALVASFTRGGETSSRT